MRRATIRTVHADPETIARSIRPDNTDEMTTTVDGPVVQTRIDRETTRSLHATVDDYVVNLGVAETVAQLTDQPMDARASTPNETTNE